MIRLYNDTTPSGKAKLYFCSHPEDRERYLPEIAKDILALQDCAIYYAEGADDQNADFWCDLEQMRLFVIPITARFLEGEHRGLAEFRFAIDKNIPVLPLMQEDGLVDRFNRICGDLQFLCKHNSDTTAISYGEKLKKYLSSVLIGDGLAEQIRKAFDAYIFLSYRKKDRRHAQTLMRLIHKHGFCRDIAIWYDEFLVPGENFNQAIQDALKKSKLFALAVTPNLVNEVNYIMTTEYPMAIEEKKPVLPILLAETDPQLLAHHYPDLPALTDAYDSSSLAEALAAHIRALELPPREKGTLHDYYIGLAYLGGIDVEPSGEMAEKLLTSAAEAGLADAMAQLSAMYRTGNGVRRNGARAVLWQRRLAEAMEVLYQAERSAEALLNWVDALFNLGELLCEELRTEEAEEVYLQIPALFGEEEPTDPKLLRRLADTHFALGGLGVNRKKEHYDKEQSSESGGYIITVSHMQRDAYHWEETHYEHAVALYQKLLETDPSDEVLIPLCQCNIRLGKIMLGKHFRATAADYCQKVVQHCEDKAGTFRLLLAQAYGVLGNIWRDYAYSESLKLSCRKQCFGYYRRAMIILNELYQDNRSPAIAREVSEACYNLAKWYQGETEAKDSLVGDKWFELSESFYRKAVSVAMALEQKTHSPADRILLGRCLLNWGKLWLKSPTKDYKTAEQILLTALDLLEEQFQKTDMFEVRYNTMQCNQSLGNVYVYLGDDEKVKKYRSRAEELSNRATYWEEINSITPIVMDPTIPGFEEYMKPSSQDEQKQ